MLWNYVIYLGGGSRNEMLNRVDRMGCWRRHRNLGRRWSASGESMALRRQSISMVRHHAVVVLTIVEVLRWWMWRDCMISWLWILRIALKSSNIAIRDLCRRWRHRRRELWWSLILKLLLRHHIAVEGDIRWEWWRIWSSIVIERNSKWRTPWRVVRHGCDGRCFSKRD